MSDPDPWRIFDGLDDDAKFADIVAHLNDDEAPDEPAARTTAGDTEPKSAPPESTAPESTGPESTALDHTAPEKTAPDSAAPEGTEPEGTPSAGLPQGDPQAVPAPQVWRAGEVDDEYEEHFEPLPLAPLPVGDLQFWAIIVGMGGGPLMLLYLVFFNRDAGSYWTLAALAISLGGFALLISRLPRHRDDDDGARL